MIMIELIEGGGVIGKKIIGLNFVGYCRTLPDRSSVFVKWLVRKRKYLFSQLV